jgi:hypothetical protein
MKFPPKACFSFLVWINYRWELCLASHCGIGHCKVLQQSLIMSLKQFFLLPISCYFVSLSDDGNCLLSMEISALVVYLAHNPALTLHEQYLGFVLLT